MHMYRAAAVAEIICDNWTGQQLNKEDIVAVSLIHDLGNIVKMGFTGERLKISLGPDILKAEYWKSVQKETIKKYNSDDDHIVTEKMVSELNISDRLMFLLPRKIFIKNEETLKSNDWELKICAYSDQRVGPYGIMSLLERLNEFKQRVTREPTTWSLDPKTDYYIGCAVKIEEQIFSNESITPMDINDETAKPYIEKYQQH